MYASSYFIHHGNLWWISLSRKFDTDAADCVDVVSPSVWPNDGGHLQWNKDKTFINYKNESVLLIIIIWEIKCWAFTEIKPSISIATTLSVDVSLSFSISSIISTSRVGWVLFNVRQSRRGTHEKREREREREADKRKLETIIKTQRKESHHLVWVFSLLLTTEARRRSIASH